MRWKLLISTALGAVMMCSSVVTNTFAADYTAYEEYEKALGLITTCSLTCTTSASGVINITAKTQVSSELEEIGYKNITIEYSKDGVNWSEYDRIEDMTKTNERYYNINNLKVEVYDEGYYRVVCVHYAKGVPLGEKTSQIQVVINTSPASYVKKGEATRPVTTTLTTTTAPKTTTSTTSSRTTSATTRKTTTTAKTTTTTENALTTQKKTTTVKATTTTEIKTTTTTAVKDNSTPPNTGSKFPTGAAAVLFVSCAFAVISEKKKD